jgi:PAS domain S-box-containing protein
MPSPAGQHAHSSSFLQVGRFVLGTSFLRNILLACLAVAALFPLYHGLLLKPAYRHLLTRLSEDEARRTAVHLMRALRIGTRPLNASMLPPEMAGVVADLKADFQLEKLKIFDPAGRVIFSTDLQEVGSVHQNPIFFEKVTKGQIYSRLVAEGGRSTEDVPIARDVVEIYIPILYQQHFLGAFEIYYDVTAPRGLLSNLLRRSSVTLLCIAMSMLLIVGTVLYRAAKAILAHREVDDALHRAHAELEKRVDERTADLSHANKGLELEVLERRQAEEALRASEARFRRLIDTMPNGIREIDTLGTITFVNPAHAKIYGYSEEELTGRSMFNLMAYDSERRQLEEHLGYLVDQQPRPSPWFSRDRTKDGRIIETQVDWSYRRDAQGQVEGLTTVISDITHRKQAEKALLDNIKFMNTLIDTIPNPVFFKDDEGVFLGCNTAYSETLGVPKDELLGRRIVDLPDLPFKRMAPEYHRQDLLLIRSPGIQIHEQQVAAADGEVKDFILFKATFRDAEGQVAGLVGIMLDITARKQAEKELKESQNLFDAFMRHLPGLAFMKDLEGRYLFINPAFSSLAGPAAPAPIGLRDDQLWDAATARQIQANDQAVFESATADSATEIIQMPDHRLRYLLTTRFPIFQENRLAGLGGVSIDITERTEAEERRQQLERQLQQAQKMEALGTLAGGIAHDFNNILAGIIGYTQIAMSEVNKESALHGYLKRVLTAGERAGDLVKQILTFSRRSEIEPTPVKIKTLVKEVLKLVRATLPVTVEMVQRIKSDATVMADPVQIHQVMMNLCANAGYAMRAKGGRLTVCLEDTVLEEAFTRQYTNLAAGPYLKLSVCDTGHGISPEHLHRIFEPFFTTKPKGEGTGMGLSVVHGIVTALKGVVTVRSTPGQGAQFDVYLPALEGEPAPMPAKAEALPSGTERILCVDDEQFQSDMCKHMLGLLGYKVQTSTSSVAALALIEADPSVFDLVITDMVMPEMTGDLLATRILQRRPDMPIIMCTGYSENITEERAKSLGIRAFALKPLAMETLARLIRQVLDTPAEMPAAKAPNP